MLYFSAWEISWRFFYKSAHPVRECSMLLPFTLSLSISLTSLYISLSYLSLPLNISPSTFLSLFSLSSSLAYLMDVFVLFFLSCIGTVLFLYHNPNFDKFCWFFKSHYLEIFDFVMFFFIQHKICWRKKNFHL